MSLLYVNEIFGPTLQGEGPSVGRPATFLRLAGCNLACSWCDTPYAWDWEKHDPMVERRAMEVVDVERRLMDAWAANTGLVIITGGEPVIQHERWKLLAARLVQNGIDVEIETAGTRFPDLIHANPTKWIVSPKLPSSGNEEHRAIRPRALEDFAALPNAYFKFVVSDDADMTAMLGLVHAMHLAPARVWVMPQGKTIEEWTATAKVVAPWAIRRGFRVSPRMHLNLWGSERGH